MTERTVSVALVETTTQRPNNTQKHKINNRTTIKLALVKKNTKKHTEKTKPEPIRLIHL